ncbi:MAG: hypothetical protein QOG62_1961 [Thermoleophilaceae bacterium]|jgi:SAM-dependent methyltransferase|nr:hypothetical protein [Thermoleophilaceae bacterium]
MEAGSPDSAKFREGQRAQWNVAAHGWQKWSAFTDAAAGHISKRLVELAGVEQGNRVLDVACGYGEPALTAARVVGDAGAVVATDISAEMITFGRQRASSEGVGNIEFVETDAAGLDFPEASFDAAVSRWGIIFEPDGEAAAQRVRTLLRDGSRMAISSWGPPDRVPFLAIPMRTALRELGGDPPPPGTPGPMSRPTPEAIGGLLEAGGFADVEVEEAEVVFEWSSPEDFTTFVREIAPPISALINPHPQDVQDATWAAITQAAKEHAGGDGTVSLPNLVLLASGTA